MSFNVSPVGSLYNDNKYIVFKGKFINYVYFVQRTRMEDWRSSRRCSIQLWTTQKGAGALHGEAAQRLEVQCDHV
jgi:hypothetical protein